MQRSEYLRFLTSCVDISVAALRQPTSSAPRGEATMVLKSAARKTTARKAPAKKTAAKKTAAKKAPAKKTPAKKTAAKKAPAKKAAAKKAAGQEGAGEEDRGQEGPGEEGRGQEGAGQEGRSQEGAGQEDRRPQAVGGEPIGEPTQSHAPSVSAAAAVPTRHTPASARAVVTVGRRTGRRSNASCDCGRQIRSPQRWPRDRARRR